MPPAPPAYPTLPPVPSVTDLFLSDPILLIGVALPLLIFGVLIYTRMRAWRRIRDLSTRNQSYYEDSASRSERYWADSAARSETMIALLTEIRDQLARIQPPPSPPAA